MRGKAGGGGGSWRRDTGGRRGGYHGNQGYRGAQRGRGQGYSQGTRDNVWKKKYETIQARLSEEQCGLTCFLSNNTPGFQGIIKYRYSDFQVNEIDYDDNIVKLTDLTVPTHKEKQVSVDEELILDRYNLEILPIETWDRINKIATSKEKTDEEVKVDVTEMSKEQRTAIHNAMRNPFKNAIVSSTKTENDKKYIVFSKFDKKVPRDVRQRWDWPGEYVHFVVYKEDCDTMQAVMLLKDALHMNFVKSSFFGYAGTKDRRAKTSQWFSLRKIEPSKLVQAASRIRNITIGDFKFENFHLKLGNLKGNRFRIALRNVESSTEVIEEAVDNLKTMGFINYYGLQRFGTRASVPTFEIGKNLLKGNYKEAIDLILDPYGSMYSILKVYKETGDVEKALNSCYNKNMDRNSIEMTLLQSLSSQGNKNYVGALSRIPRNARLLYLHSYQSLIWNKCVSERIRLHGRVCCEGDLVPLNCDKFTEELDDLDKEQESDDDSEQNSKDDEDEPLSEQVNPGKRSNKYLDEKCEELVKVVTKEDVDSKKYSIFDVVMPLPGYKIQYPPNMKDYYQSLMEADGLTLELKNKIKSYSLSGTYRRIILKPEDFNWKIVKYSNPNCDLILSDKDEIFKKTLTDIEEDGKYQALILEFNLPSSTYATMALRELLKADTSAETQASKNNYHKDDPSTPKAPEVNINNDGESAPTTVKIEPKIEDSVSDSASENDKRNISEVSGDADDSPKRLKSE